MLGHLVGQRGGNDGLAHDGVLGHGPLLDTASADIIQQQHTHFVAGEQLIAAVLALDGNAHTVGIGVGGQHQVGTGLFGQFQTQAQCLKNFGVGIRAGGEVAVRVLLLGHNGDIGDADVLQHMGDGHQAGTVQRAVNQLQACGLADAGTDGAGLDGFVQGINAIIAHVFDQSLGHAVLKGDQLGAGEDIGLLDLGIDDIRRLIGHLAAVRAIGLVTVVLGGVVAGRDHDAGVAVIVPGGKRKRRHRHQRLVDAHLDAVGRQHLGRRAGKQIALDTAVIADGHRLGAALGLDPVGQALGCLPYHINIHAVGAGADHTAQTGGTELQGHGKAVLNGRIVPLDTLQFRFEVGVIQVGCQPTLIHILIHK